MTGSAVRGAIAELKRVRRLPLTIWILVALIFGLAVSGVARAYFAGTVEEAVLTKDVAPYQTLHVGDYTSRRVRRYALPSTVIHGEVLLEGHIARKSLKNGAVLHTGDVTSLPVGPGYDAWTPVTIMSSHAKLLASTTGAAVSLMFAPHEQATGEGTIVTAVLLDASTSGGGITLLTVKVPPDSQAEVLSLSGRSDLVVAPG